ncbi:MAG: isochorismatase family protein [Acidimicrobiaceae bacterium]|nr:isochorismatase family protein [Acidimicrobiaceae bacterium]MYF43206.1 isochorismatase family protein [Acidimicrobiaceae bacterium]MYJ35380.1 isochorismatase family protein [Acidimicrobiaceae bacterium]
MYPWHDAIPPDDTARYLAAGYGDTFSGDEFRAISAGTSPALVVVDMTLAFVDGRWPTGCPETAWPAVDANARLLDEFRRLGYPVYFTKLYADPGHVPFPGQKGRWKTVGRRPPAEDLPPGDVIVDELAPKPDELVICKSHKPSGFFGTELAALLVYDRVDTVVVTGLTTSGCVRATAVDAFQYNFDVVIPFECVADRSQISHKVNLLDLHMKYADVAPLDHVIDWLNSLQN